MRNGTTYHTFTLLRGLREGCPLSPLLFNLYFNIMLYHIFKHTPLTTHHSMHTFIDDILFSSPQKHLTQKSFNIFDTTTRSIGLNMNNSKTELHALGTATHVTIKSTNGATLSTTSNSGSPHTYYKYLGIFLITIPNPQLLYELCSAEIKNLLFTALPSIPQRPGVGNHH